MRELGGVIVAKSLAAGIIICLCRLAILNFANFATPVAVAVHLESLIRLAKLVSYPEHALFELWPLYRMFIVQGCINNRDSQK